MKPLKALRKRFKDFKKKQQDDLVNFVKNKEAKKNGDSKEPPAEEPMPQVTLDPASLYQREPSRDEN